MLSCKSYIITVHAIYTIHPSLNSELGILLSRQNAVKMNQTFNSFITDNNNAPVLDYLRRLSNTKKPPHTCIVIRGPSGVGKTHLCKTLAHLKIANYYNSQDIVSMLKLYLQKKIHPDNIIEMISGNNVIIDDTDFLIGKIQLSRINGELVDTCGSIMQEILTNLILENKKAGHFVLLSSLGKQHNGAKINNYGDNIAFYLDYPERSARIAYCKESLRQKKQFLPKEEIERLVDTCEHTLPEREGTIQTVLAKKMFNERKASTMRIL